MPVPFEAVLPYALCLGFFAVAGASLSSLRQFQNGGKRPLRTLDTWDEQMLRRNKRFTGFSRGQSDVQAEIDQIKPNNPWLVERRIC